MSVIDRLIAASREHVAQHLSISPDAVEVIASGYNRKGGYWFARTTGLSEGRQFWDETRFAK